MFIPQMGNTLRKELQTEALGTRCKKKGGPETALSKD